MNNSLEKINCNMIILGRESRGLSQKMLADELGVTQGRISKIEMGLLPISDDLLESLSATLRYPKEFFMQEGALIGVGTAEIFHRKRQSISKKALSKTYAQMEIRLRHVMKLLQSVEIPENVPRFDVDSYDGRVEDIARLVREYWRLPRGPVKDLSKTIENEGGLIIPIDLETPQIDATSRWVPKLPPLFFINKNSPKDRYRYSLAHELGHIVMHQYLNPDLEDQANRYAAEFLLPEREIRADLNNVTLAKLPELKRYWRVSMNAILKRAEDLHTITPNQARYLWTQMSQAGYRTREPIELDVQGEDPFLIKELIETYQDELGYSLKDLSQMLTLHEEEVSSLYFSNNKRPPLRIIHNS
jgi:Zn-dependent peptidase ImmA (M78 family)/DNA-binding XRE family transcriptional regulator